SSVVSGPPGSKRQWRRPRLGVRRMSLAYPEKNRTLCQPSVRAWVERRASYPKGNALGVLAKALIVLQLQHPALVISESHQLYATDGAPTLQCMPAIGFGTEDALQFRLKFSLK